MNKKFSTFLVSMLLAGGMFSANGQVSKMPSAVAGNGFYHVLKFDTRETSGNTNVKYDGTYSLGVDGKSLVTVKEKDGKSPVTKDNVWTVTEVKINGSSIGYEFTNANGVKLQFDENGNFTTDASKVKYSVFGLSGGKFDAKTTDGSSSTMFITQDGDAAFIVKSK